MPRHFAIQPVSFGILLSSNHMSLQARQFAITCTFSDAFCAVLQLCLPYGSIDWPDTLIKASFPPPNAPWYPQGVPLQKGHKKMPKKKRTTKRSPKKKHAVASNM
jgi:hypothetical protein